MNKDTKIYIAGHRGLVGSAVHRVLQSQGYTNFVFKTSSELDLRDEAAVETFFATEKPEYVFLAAAKVGGIMANNTYRADFILDNLKIQNNVIGASYRHNAKKLLFLGSTCIYPKDAPNPIKEESLLTGPLEYTNEPYAIAKIAGIKLIESLNIQYGTNYLAVQPTNLYGVNDNFDLEKSHVMPALIRKTYLAKLLEEGDYQAIAKNLGVVDTAEAELEAKLEGFGIVKEGSTVTLKVWGSGKPRREFLHVDDMAAACVFVMNNVNFADLTADQTEVRNTHINIGTGSDITIDELVHMIREIIGFKGDIAFDASKPDGTMRKLTSVEKLNKLGWRHSIELEQGLAQTINWYLKEQQL
jgi:GDP-L-fucose synthase